MAAETAETLAAEGPGIQLPQLGSRMGSDSEVVFELKAPLLEKRANHKLVQGKVGEKHHRKIWQADAMLDSLQCTGLFLDQKTIVDMPLKTSLHHVEAAFHALQQEANGPLMLDVVQDFMDKHFDAAGSDLLPYVPQDYEPEPEDFLPNVNDPEIRKWALKVHTIWLELARIQSPSVMSNPDNHTLLGVPNVLAVPGSRFREVYYWDSYWMIRGLLVSKMPTTAKGIVQNLLSLAQRYGFVPNGARSYYVNRSQPPLLSEMVKVIYEASNDMALVQESLPILVREHEFWTSDQHAVRICDAFGRVHSLSRYHANWDKPRPESYCQDKEAAIELDAITGARLYTEIASAAESGWDFSSRWMGDGRTWQSFATTSIIPVDLNSFLYQMEGNISQFAALVGDKVTSAKFSVAATKRKEAITALLWNEEESQWFDYWLPFDPLETNSSAAVQVIWAGGQQNKATYASNFVPLWCGVLERGDARASQVVEALQNSGLLQPSGIATSIYLTGEQWDFPNAWAPLQHMIIEGLEATGLECAHTLAKDLVARFLYSVWVGFRLTGAMHEKYDARAPGGVGGGGEYAPQVGFGWTNGVTLALLAEYGWLAKFPDVNLDLPPIGPRGFLEMS